MSPSPAPEVRLGRPLVSVLALLVLAQLMFAMSIRLPYPFALEWMEGGVLEHVRRVLAGQPLFGPPTVEFVPYIYAPLYYYLGALAAEVLGLSLPVLRGLSVVCTLGTLGLLGWSAGRALPSGSWGQKLLLGVCTAGLFAATWPLSGTFFDLARVDMLFVLLTLGAGVALLEGKGLTSAGLAGGLLGLAFLSKQSALPWGGVLLAGMVVRQPRRALLAGASFGLVGGMGSVLFAADAMGWYTYYLFELPGSHALDWQLSLQLLGEDLLFPLWPALGLVGLSLWHTRSRQAPEWGYLLLGFGGLLTAWASRVHVGGYHNVVLPLHVMVCLLAGRGLARLLGSRREGWALGLMGLNLLLLFRDVSPLLPTEADRLAGEQLVSQLQLVPGEVWVPGHPELAWAAGKAAGAHWMAMEDVLRGTPGPAREGLIQSLRQALQSHRFEAILLEGPPPPVLLQAYELQRPVFAQPEVFKTVTGMQTRPETWWQPRVKQEPPPSTLPPSTLPGPDGTPDR